MTRALVLACCFMLAPALLASGAKAPLPQMKPCVAIDNASITSVIRIVKLVAKSDYEPGKATKKEFYDRLPAGHEPERPLK